MLPNSRQRLNFSKKTKTVSRAEIVVQVMGKPVQTTLTPERQAVLLLCFLALLPVNV
jgi:hypothetical protein